MKKIFFTVLSLISFAAFAQQPILVDMAPKDANSITQSAFRVSIPQATLNDVKKDWLKYMSNNSKGKANEENGEFIQYRAVNKNISPKPFDIYSKLLETTQGVEIAVRLTQNNKSFVSKNINDGTDLAVKKYLHDFAVIQYRNAVQLELDREIEKQKQLEKKLSALIDEEEKSAQKIINNQRSTGLAVEAISVKDSDIQSATDKIHDQKQMVTYTASDPNAHKGAKKTLKELESEKKDLQKASTSEGKQIDSRDIENREEERKIKDLQQQQELVMKSLENQKKLIFEVRNKLANIK